MPKKISGARRGKRTAGSESRKKTSRGQAGPAEQPASGQDQGTPRERSLKKQLLRKRDDLLKETQEELSKYIKGENRQLVESALDGGDWSVIDLSEDINLMRLRSNQETLNKIDEALRKLEEKTYGMCEDCGEEINAERLRVMPFAIRCRDCQEIREEAEAVEREAAYRYRG
jgi:DnaK suppressor protein